ncbi:hypothetical protein [Paraburkholderia elongata]|nr:hypothetical protein [Paraburkholderia elongata]
MNYDIIGDIHGQAEKLRALLQRLGYREQSGQSGAMSTRSLRWRRRIAPAKASTKTWTKRCTGITLRLSRDHSPLPSRRSCNQVQRCMLEHPFASPADTARIDELARVVRKCGDRVELISRQGNSFAASFPDIIAPIERVPGDFV